MRRRTVIKRSVLCGGIATLAGCSSDDTPPPRRSNVIESVETAGNTLEISLENDVWVDSRADLDASSSSSRLRERAERALPVGTAAAAKGSSRGASGRGSGGFSNAPKTDKGRAWYGGGTYVGGWYRDHDDDVERYESEVVAVGVGYHGTSSQFRDDPPGPKPITWDDEFTERREAYEHTVSQQGWYRVGANLRDPVSGHDFGWESVDFELVSNGTGYRLENEWKVSPRI